ncbi:tandem-95 repeat protein [Brevibacillus daliensis]|uniref:tandem-95 repeat protein n=1 Tax=Brevibacillus daliensis TaxID=2892995 RepID=UPI001E312F29|nr:tandem-95 repeat protein [Brevibacillus daliensis]
MAFFARYSTTANGAITFTGNTLIRSKQVNANAPGTQQTIGTFIKLNTSLEENASSQEITNNYILHSTSAFLGMPEQSFILYAELIWAGRYQPDTENVSEWNNPITFITSKGTYSIAPDTATVNTISTRPYYVRSANVTAHVHEAGVGRYTFCYVSATQRDQENTLRHAGWSLAVVYQNIALPLRNLTVFIRGGLVDHGITSQSAVISGFVTPIKGAVRGRLHVSALKGDPTITCDQLLIGPTANKLRAVSGTNKSILDKTGKVCNITSSSGSMGSVMRHDWDIKNIDISSKLINSQSTAYIRGTINGDAYMINALALQIDMNDSNFSEVTTSSATSSFVDDRHTESGSTRYDVIGYPLRFNLSSQLVMVTTLENTSVSGLVPVYDTDLNSLFFTILESPATGTAVIDATGTFVYTPYPNVNGTDRFIVGIEDDSGGFSSFSVTVKVVPVSDAPFTRYLALTTLEDKGVKGQVNVIESDRSNHIFSLQTPPVSGTASVWKDGTFIYTPHHHYYGPDSFEVLVEDGIGGTEVTTVIITVFPTSDPPHRDSKYFITPEDEAVSGTIQTCDSDREELQYYLNLGPVNGQVIVNRNGSFTYTPANRFGGVDMFSVLLRDKNGAISITRVYITVGKIINPPVITDQSFITAEDSTIEGRISVIDRDNGVVRFSLLEAPRKGTVFVNVDGTFTYSPVPDFSGVDSFLVSVDDGNGETAQATISIQVTAVIDESIQSDLILNTQKNIAVTGQLTAVHGDTDPVIFTLVISPASGSVSLQESGSFLYVPNLDFTGEDSFTVQATDPDGGTETSVVMITVVPIIDVPFEVGRTYTTENENKTTDSIDISSKNERESPCSDSREGADSEGSAITFCDPLAHSQLQEEIRNRTKMFASLTLYARAGKPLHGHVPANDPDGRALQFTLVMAPMKGIVRLNQDGQFMYTPSINVSGTDTFTIQVTDSRGEVSLVNITFLIMTTDRFITFKRIRVCARACEWVSGRLDKRFNNIQFLSWEVWKNPKSGQVKVTPYGKWKYINKKQGIKKDKFVFRGVSSLGEEIFVRVAVKIKG